METVTIMLKCKFTVYNVVSLLCVILHSI